MQFLVASKPRILSIEYTGPLVDLGAEAARAMPPGRRHRYKRPIGYRIEGHEGLYSGMCKGMSKAKVAGDFELRQEWIASGRLYGWFDDKTGEFIGTTMVF